MILPPVLFTIDNNIFFEKLLPPTKGRKEDFREV